MRRFVTLFLCFSILSGATFAQTRTVRRGATAVKTTTKTQNPLDPNAGWSGVVTYTKTLSETFNSDEPVFGRIDKQRNRVKHNRTREYKYEGRLFVDGSKPQLVTNTQVSLSDEEKEKGHQVIVDSCHAFNDDHEFIDDSRDEKITKGFAEGPARDFNLSAGFLTGLYHFSFQFPEGKGTYSREEHVTHKGYCQPKNNSPYDRTTNEPTRIEGQSVSIDGQIDPDNPDVILGSKTWGGEKVGATVTFKYTVTWSFRRNPGEVEIENIAFDEHPYPDFESWKEKSDGETVDSNLVRIRAKLVNYSTETKFPKIEFRENKEDIQLPDGETNISIAPGEQREVEYTWDTSGFAWKTGAVPASERQIKVEVTGENIKKRDKTKDIIVIPKPVVLVHGLWADYTAWDGYSNYLHSFHSLSWHSYAVGADPANGVMNTGEKGSLKPTNTIAQNAEQLEKQIEFVRREHNAWHIDVVAHSMGGIITRYYIYNKMKIVPDDKPVIEHLVMLGTPNMGSPCANLIYRTVAPFGVKPAALGQLDKGYMHWFNENAGINRKGTKFSNLVGTIVPATCISPVNGDGVVEWTSAVWLINDFRFVGEIHTKLTDEQYFRNFVLKRLAISRLGDHQPDRNYRQTMGGLNYAPENKTGFANVSYSPDDNSWENAPQDFKINFGKQLTFQPKQSETLEIPVSAANSSGITIVAPSNVSATVLDETGAVVAKNTAGTPESTADFRTIRIEKEMKAPWKLKLENTGAKEAGAIVSAWTETKTDSVQFTVAAGKATATGQIPLQARLLDGASPIAGATVKVKLLADDKDPVELTLADDGAHGDSTANDGVYGTVTEKLPNGNYSLAARAENRGNVYLSAASFTVGQTATAIAPKTTAKPKPAAKHR